MQDLVQAVQDPVYGAAVFCGCGGTGHLLEELVGLSEIYVSFVCLSESTCQDSVAEF